MRSYIFPTPYVDTSISSFSTTMPSRPRFVRQLSEALSPGATAPSPYRTNLTEALNSAEAGSRGAFSYFDIPPDQNAPQRRNREQTPTCSIEQSSWQSHLFQASTSLGAGRRNFEGPQITSTSSHSPRGRSQSLNSPPSSSTSSSDTTGYSQRIFGIPRQRVLPAQDGLLKMNSLLKRPSHLAATKGLYLASGSYNTRRKNVKDDD